MRIEHNISIQKIPAIIFSIGVIILMSFSMSQVSVGPEEYLRLYNLNKSACTQNILDDKIEYSLMYVPNELRLISLDSRGLMSEEIYEEFKAERNEYLEFLLQISNPETGEDVLKFIVDESISYDDRLNYYSFEMQHDIKIVVDKIDTINCSDFVFERNFGSSPKTNFTIGFNHIKTFKEIEIVMINKMIGDKPVVFRFSNKDFKVLGTLKNYKKWRK